MQEAIAYQDSISQRETVNRLSKDWRTQNLRALSYLTELAEDKLQRDNLCKEFEAEKMRRLELEADLRRGVCCSFQNQNA